MSSNISADQYRQAIHHVRAALVNLDIAGHHLMGGPGGPGRFLATLSTEELLAYMQKQAAEVEKKELAKGVDRV
jgi:hypothetical protein